MAEKSEIKVTRTYSLDPEIIAWVTQRAARLTIESKTGERTSDSKVVNDILRSAMESQQLPLPPIEEKKRSDVVSRNPEPVAA